jgi:hypothetical protein
VRGNCLHHRAAAPDPQLRLDQPAHHCALPLCRDGAPHTLLLLLLLLLLLPSVCLSGAARSD